MINSWKFVNSTRSTYRHQNRQPCRKEASEHHRMKHRKRKMLENSKFSKSENENTNGKCMFFAKAFAETFTRVFAHIANVARQTSIFDIYEYYLLPFAICNSNVILFYSRHGCFLDFHGGQVAPLSGDMLSPTTHDEVHATGRWYWCCRISGTCSHSGAVRLPLWHPLNNYMRPFIQPSMVIVVGWQFRSHRANAEWVTVKMILISLASATETIDAMQRKFIFDQNG